MFSTVHEEDDSKEQTVRQVMCLLQCYILENCFAPLYVITELFNPATNLQLSTLTLRRDLRMKNKNSHVATQKSFPSRRNVRKRIQWGLLHKG